MQLRLVDLLYNIDTNIRLPKVRNPYVAGVLQDHPALSNVSEKNAYPLSYLVTMYYSPGEWGTVFREPRYFQEVSKFMN